MKPSLICLLGTLSPGLVQATSIATPPKKEIAALNGEIALIAILEPTFASLGALALAASVLLRRR